jgi:hypothetical protein
VFREVVYFNKRKTIITDKWVRYTI